MQMLSLLVTLPLASALTYLVLPRHFWVACNIAKLILLLFLTLTTVLFLGSHAVLPAEWNLFTFGDINISLKLFADSLTLMMLLLLSVISLVVIHYAARYLYSDLNRNRFMFQISLVTFSVSLLVMSGNLLTAFVGWQFIGFSLYWLLNHYHYDPAANRAAKKKFVINRVGDMCFLFAVILCLIYYANTDFQVLFSQSSPMINILGSSVEVRSLILSLIFIAIMTKSAQFPFHLWLPDTMQTPTPVSAMMHAGVINAGGFLLARLSPALIYSGNLLTMITLIGLITLIIGSLFYLTQPDIKKKLAYSTMSQMGYMIVQCGVGCFAGAIFHLITHGFFKAWSFLNSGNTLFYEKKSVARVQPVKTLALTVIITALIIGIQAFFNESIQKEIVMYPLLMTFILITVMQCVNSTLIQNSSIKAKFITLVLLFGISLAYLKVLYVYLVNSKTIMALTGTTIHPTLQIILSFTLVLLQLGYIYLQQYRRLNGSPVSRVQYYVSNKLFVENIFRACLLNPLRKLGDKFYQFFERQKLLSYALLIGVIAVSLFGYLSGYHLDLLTLSLLSAAFMFFIITSNRAKRLDEVVFFLFLSQIILGIIALVTVGALAFDIAIYQFYNSVLILLVMKYILVKLKGSTTTQVIQKNRLPWLAGYFTACLFCLIGLPGTSSFISEIVIIMEIFGHQPAFAFVILAGIILLTISVLHALQDYIFNASQEVRFSVKASIFDHSLCFMVLGLNIMSGIFPSSVMKIIDAGVKVL